METDAGHLHGSVLLAVHETGKAHDPRLVHAHRIAVKVLYKLRLYHTETLHLGGRIHEPVDMIGFLRFHDHGRRERESIDLFLLLVKAVVVHLHELRVDPRNGIIVLPAVVDHEEDAAVHSVVVLERFFYAFVLPAFAGKLRPLEHTALLIVKDAEADGIGRIK